MNLLYVVVTCNVIVSVNSSHDVKNVELIKKKRFYNDHYPSIFVTFWGETEHFSGIIIHSTL